MLLRRLANIQSGHHSRGRIEPLAEGSHFLFQARDVDVHSLTYRIDAMIRFCPDLSRRDVILKKDDILFMARGIRNYSVLVHDIPAPTLAAAYFFIVRVSNKVILPGYLCWYLNQYPVEHYLNRQSGRGVHMPVVRRSVLENIEVPVPSLEVQETIVEMDKLMQEEQELLNKLVEKRKELITKACLQAVK
jgi:restriction endonuclease S subunit